MSKKYKTELFFELSDYEKGIDRNNFTLRTYALDHLQINGIKYYQSTFAWYPYPLKITDLLKYTAKRILNKHAFIRITEKSYKEIKKLLPAHPLYLDGYWQNEKFFNIYRDELIRQFAIKHSLTGICGELLDRIKNSGNSVGVHIRRGDYVKNPDYTKKYGLCSIDYYIKAIEYCNGHLKDPVFFIFSDDISWAKENIPIPDAVFIDHDNPPWIDLELLKNCRHQVIANSTFSWWAAWLNENQDKIVIAPERWYNDPVLNEERKDLVPSEWVRM